MKVQITHLKAPWPAGAVVGDVLDLPAVHSWAVGKCKHVDDDVELTIGVMLSDEGDDTVTGDGTGESLPLIVEGDGDSLQLVEVTNVDSIEPEFIDVAEEAETIATGEGEGVGQPIPGIEKPQGPANVMIGSGLKKPGKHK